ALLAKEVKTPICLDESIISLQSAEDALALKATTIINIKPGRVGGYRRIKLKIEPGWDIEAVKHIRNLYPAIPLQVDANQAYSRDDGKHLAKLDEFNLLLIEQPLDEHDILGHALLAKEVKTPICLDESIISLQSAQDALALKATTIINIKPGRVGGYIESVKIHDLCLKNKIPVWCGGMLETGIGRAANLALAALPGFTLPGDTSASARYFKQDITTPFVMEDGYLNVPQSAGIGVEPDLDFLEQITTHKEKI
ncbi:MAG: O-succinylbenzoate synthase, partial [Actinomycetota bacterium]